MIHTGYSLDGGTVSVVRDYKLSATVEAGEPVVAGGTGGTVTDPTTTSLASMLGLVLGASDQNLEANTAAGTLTYSATQGDVEGLVRVVVNPLAVFKAKIAGSATSGASLTKFVNSTADATGLTLSSTSLGTASMTGGTVKVLSGNNAGLSRRVTAFTNSVSLAVTVPFPRTLSTSDDFIVVPYLPGRTTAMQLTSNFLEANGIIVVGTGAGAICVELLLNSESDSWVYWVSSTHLFKNA